MKDMNGNLVEESQPTSSLGLPHGETSDLQSQDQGQQGKAKKDRNTKLKVLKDMPKKASKTPQQTSALGNPMNWKLGNPKNVMIILRNLKNYLK